MNTQKELERVNLVSYITALLGEIREKIEDLQTCLFIVKELTKDYELEVGADVKVKKARIVPEGVAEGEDKNRDH